MDEGLQKLVRFIYNENPSLAPHKTLNPAQLSDFFIKHPEYKGVINKRAILDSGEKFGLKWIRFSNGCEIIEVKTIVRKEVQTTLRAPNAFYHLDTLRTYILETEGQSSTPIKWSTSFLGQFFSRHPECKGHINKAAVENAPHHLKLSWITVASKNYIVVGINTPTTTEIPPVTHQQVTIPGGPCFQFVDDISKATELINQLRNVSVIGLDIEGDLSRGGQLSIIQVSMDTQDEGVRVFIFDILKCPQIIDVGGLQDILSQKGITKVLHDCRQDCQALFSQHNVRLCNVFDTQVAYAELHMEHGQQRGLNTVLDQYAEGANNKLKGEIIHRRGLWDSRPLAPELLSYAAQDVESIIAAHRKMKRDLEEQGKLQIVMERVDNIIDGICSVHVQSNVDASDCLPMGLLHDYPMGTTKFIQFNEIGECILSHEPFIKGEGVKDKTVPPNRDLKDLYELADILPKDIRKAFYDFPVRDFTTEIVLDMGRRPLVRYVLSGGDGDDIQTCSGELGCREICRKDLDQICKSEKLGSYTSDNRAGFSSTLHRISRKLNRSGQTIALTLRVGRMVQGSTQMITDIVSSSRSVLLLGIPGVGKTTLLREYSRVLACSNKRVEIVDTSNEIAGDGDVPHHSVGQARRMMVNDRREQHRVMIEAVQNHMPQCIIVDEIGTKAEANAAGDIAQRGVQIVATAHGKRVSDLLQSAELCGLVGGLHTVILGDEEAQRRGLRSKSVRERKGPPVFDTIVEIRSHHHWVVYHDVASAVDDILGGRTSPVFEVRSLDPATGEITVTKTNIFE